VGVGVRVLWGQYGNRGWYDNSVSTEDSFHGNPMRNPSVCKVSVCVGGAATVTVRVHVCVRVSLSYI